MKKYLPYLLLSSCLLLLISSCGKQITHFSIIDNSYDATPDIIGISTIQDSTIYVMNLFEKDERVSGEDFTFTSASQIKEDVSSKLIQSIYMIFYKSGSVLYYAPTTDLHQTESILNKPSDLLKLISLNQYLDYKKVRDEYNKHLAFINNSDGITNIRLYTNLDLNTPSDFINLIVSKKQLKIGHIEYIDSESFYLYLKPFDSRNRKKIIRFYCKIKNNNSTKNEINITEIQFQKLIKSQGNLFTKTKVEDIFNFPQLRFEQSKIHTHF